MKMLLFMLAAAALCVAVVYNGASDKPLIGK
jgi:hypothetical protein